MSDVKSDSGPMEEEEITKTNKNPTKNRYDLDSELCACFSFVKVARYSFRNVVVFMGS